MTSSWLKVLLEGSDATLVLSFDCCALTMNKNVYKITEYILQGGKKNVWIRILESLKTENIY